jgi:cytoskeletal protein CcmA (bactofilin family)
MIWVMQKRQVDASIYNEHFTISGYMMGINNDRLAINDYCQAGGWGI